MFKSVRIKNFRGIRDLTINDLKRINILVGDNATGKTAILDAIYILINPANPDLPLKTNDWRNLAPFTPSFWRSLFFNFDYKNEIELSANNGKKRIVNIKPKVSTTMIVSPSPSPDGRGNGELKASSEIEKALSGISISFQIGKTKYESSIEQTTLDVAKLNPNTVYKETLQGHYFNNKTYVGEIDLTSNFDIVNQEVGKEQIIEFLKKFKPEIKDIELDRFKKLLVKDTLFGNKRVHLNTYGDGIIRGLHMLLSILAKHNGITLIDEVENGLHWSKQELVWEFIHAIVKERGQQLFITTHSREMVHHLYNTAKRGKFKDLIKVYRLQNVKNEIKIVPYDEKQLEFAIVHSEEFR